MGETGVTSKSGMSGMSGMSKFSVMTWGQSDNVRQMQKRPVSKQWQRKEEFEI